MRLAQMIGLLALTCLASPQDSAPLAFEVASVKTSTANPGGWSTSNITSQFSVKGAPLRELIKLAWGLQDFEIEAPKSLDGPRFDVVGKLPEGAPRTQAAVNRMMQSLLIDQFQLTFHREKRDVNGYALVLGKSGLKLPKAAAPGQTTGTNSGNMSRVYGKDAPLTTLASQLSRVLNDPVVLQIQNEDRYDYDLRWDSGDRPSTPAGAEPLATAAPVQTLAGALDQAGLKLEKRKVPLELFVVDKMEKTPREQ